MRHTFTALALAATIIHCAASTPIERDTPIKNVEFVVGVCPNLQHHIMSINAEYELYYIPEPMLPFQVSSIQIPKEYEVALTSSTAHDPGAERNPRAFYKPETNIPLTAENPKDTREYLLLTGLPPQTDDNLIDQCYKQGWPGDLPLSSTGLGEIYGMKEPSPDFDDGKWKKRAARVETMTT